MRRGAAAAVRLALAASLLSPFGCGYSLVGKGVTVDPSIRRVGVPIFKDRSGKAGLDQVLTKKVITELLRRGRFDVVQQRDDVDALVDGEILTYNMTPIGFSGGELGPTQASRFAVTVTARIVYGKVGAAQPIWTAENFTVREEVEISDNPSEFFDREEQTWELMGEAFARNLAAAMLEAF
jgi:hypothetical protein